MKSVRKKAFTLFEVLVALSVILIISGAGLFSLGQGKEKRALDKAAQSLHSVIQIARTQAITNGVHSRMIINYDTSDRENCLRRIGVMIEDKESGSGYWRAVERGLVLPLGVYVVPWGGTEVSFSADWTEKTQSIYRKEGNNATPALYTFDYPLKASVSETSGGKPRWICYQFAPNGRLAPVYWGGGDDPPQSNRIVIANAHWSGDKIAFDRSDRLLGVSFKFSGASIQNEVTELEDMN